MDIIGNVRNSNTLNNLNIMKTTIKAHSRIQALRIITKLQKFNINYTEEENGNIQADITPARAWAIGF